MSPESEKTTANDSLIFEADRQTTVDTINQQQTQRQKKTPIMSANEEEPPVFYPDARDGLLTSATDARRKALLHFDHFLRGHCKQIDIPVVKGEDTPHHGILRKQTEKEIFAWWDTLLGAFVTHLGKHARASCNPKVPRISRSTATGHCSAVKNH